MSRAVFVGGFCNGRSTTEKVGKSLEAYFSDVDVFTFSDHIKKDSEVQRAANGATLITLSAGALILPKLVRHPKSVYLLNPPLPTPLPLLVVRGITKTARLYIPNKGLHSVSELPAVSAFSRSTIAEFTAHPIANYGQLINISKFDAVATAIAAKRMGMDVHLAWTDQDVYFRPTQTDYDLLSANGIQTSMLAGEHDEVILRPCDYLKAVFSE